MLRFWVPMFALQFLAGPAVSGGPLDPRDWEMSGPNREALGRAVDNNLKTFWRSPSCQMTGTGILIDLGKRVYVHRVFVTPGGEEAWFPRSLRVLAGESPQSLPVAAEQNLREAPDKDPRYWLPLRFHPESNITFAPRKCRYLRVEIGQNSAGFPWAIGELEIYAAQRRVPDDRWSAIIVDKDAPEPLQLAARELRYYLTELLDVPAKILTPEESEGYRGVRVRLVTPDAEELPYPENDPPHVEDVSVVMEGSEIVISGPTQRAVLYGAYEFLHRQGVRWLYAGHHGDYVPRRRALRRSILPIRYRPPFRTRYANFPVRGLATRAKTEDGFLFFVRHHFNNTWGAGLRGTLGGLPPRASLGFGYIHNLRKIIPEEALKEHPDWTSGPYRKGWDKVPCTTNPEVVDYIMKRIGEEDTKKPSLQAFSVHPTDVPSFCECERCTGLFGSPHKFQEDKPDDFAGAYDYSDHYFHLIGELARRVQKDLPGKGVFALAYANHGKPPSRIDRLPDNVMVDVTLHWKHNLPISSPKNVPHAREIEAWAAKCGQLGIYDYVLIHTDTTFGRPAGEWYTLVPLVSPIADHHRFFHKLGVTSVGTQAMGDICWSSPWSVYAYARTAWDPEEPTEQILKDFFGGFYREASKPMLRWYRALEDHIVGNDVAYSGGVGTYGPVPEAFPHAVVREMRGHLEDARKRARTWFVRQRVAHAAKCLEWSYQVAHGQDNRPVYGCFRVPAPPTIDGRMDEAAWKGLPSQTGFRVATTDNFAFTRQTSFRIGWDDRNLYLGVHCVEPAVPEVKKRTAGEAGYIDISEVSWAKFYHDLIEVFWAPGEPIYFQTMVNAIGQYVGPNRHVGHMHNREPIAREGFECRTFLGDGWWEMEAQFSFAALGQAPRDGEKWKANLVRVSSQEKGKGEQFTCWPHVERFNFHQRSQYNWISFHDRALDSREVQEIEQDLNGRFSRARQEHERFRQELATFGEFVAGKVNLCSPEKGAGAWGTGRNAALLFGNRKEGWTKYGPKPYTAVIRWKEPAELNALRIQWGSRKELPRWYGVEWFDGESYLPLVEKRENHFEQSFHQFEKIKTSRLRLTIFEIGGGSQTTLVRRVEVFNL